MTTCQQKHTPSEAYNAGIMEGWGYYLRNPGATVEQLEAWVDASALAIGASPNELAREIARGNYAFWRFQLAARKGELKITVFGFNLTEGASDET